MKICKFGLLLILHLTMKNVHFIFCLILFPVFLSAQSITLEEFGPNFTRPVSIKNAGDSRLFIVEQLGYIRILKTNGTTPSSPFLDIDDRVIGIEASWERGLLGLAFHPNYTSNGYFYVQYVGDDADADGVPDSYISRFSVSAGDADLADPNSELIIMTIPHPYDAHYGGDITFGSDGYLYIGKGDGGNSIGDPENRAQDLNEPLGKILRIDIDNPANNTFGNNYGIPATNPFANDGDPNTLGEIWSYGLRNPAKFSFDSLTGDMWISDTGQSTLEEIDLDVGNVGGLNYGWRCYEGTDEFNTSSGCPNLSTITFPISEFLHFDPDGIFRCAVIGGYRYRGTSQSNLYGVYFFADWCSDEIYMLTENGSNWNKTIYTPTVSTQRWTGFGEDNNGELYIIGNSGDNGKVHKIKQNTLSTNSIELKSNFNIIPNPTSNGKITLSFVKNISLKEINVFNLHGQNIKANISIINSNTVSLKFNELSSGIYIIEAISISGERSQNKIIIK